MSDIINFAESEFGIPLLDMEYDHMEHQLNRDLVLGQFQKNNYYAN